MINSFIFFETSKELEELTGLSQEALWTNGFDLDDMDWGFCADQKFVKETINEYGFKEFNIVYSNESTYATHILQWMDDYCVGFKYVEYNNKHYYILYHA